MKIRCMLREQPGGVPGHDSHALMTGTLLSDEEPAMLPAPHAPAPAEVLLC